MTTPSTRESHYIVIKRSDLASYPEDTQKLLDALPQRDAVVVETEWPEYESTWRAIEARMSGSASTKAEPEVQVEALVREIHQAVKRGRDTEDHGLLGNLRCILDHVLPYPDAQSQATAPITAPTTVPTAIEWARQAGLVAVPNSKPIAVQGLLSELETLIQRVRNEALEEAKQAVAALECPSDEDNFEAGCMYGMHVIDQLKS